MCVDPSGEEAQLTEHYEPLTNALINSQRRVLALPNVEPHQPRAAKLGLRTGWARRYFRPEPKQWGLRGDPWLWLELQATLELVKDPQSVERFEELLWAIIKELTGEDFQVFDDVMVAVERYPHLGMSGGSVCPPTWRDDLVPLLVDRYADVR